jgi:hypothetical protein
MRKSIGSLKLQFSSALKTLIKSTILRQTQPCFLFMNNWLLKIQCHFVFKNLRPLSLFPQFLKKIEEVFQGELDFSPFLEFSVDFGMICDSFWSY